MVVDRDGGGTGIGAMGMKDMFKSSNDLFKGRVGSGVGFSYCMFFLKVVK